MPCFEFLTSFHHVPLFYSHQSLLTLLLSPFPPFPPPPLILPISSHTNPNTPCPRRRNPQSHPRTHLQAPPREKELFPSFQHPFFHNQQIHHNHHQRHQPQTHCQTQPYQKRNRHDRNRGRRRRNRGAAGPREETDHQIRNTSPQLRCVFGVYG